MMAIRSYTNRAFVGTIYFKGDIRIEDGMFITTSTMELQDGDIIEIFGSKYSDGVYLMKGSTSTYEVLRNEDFKGYIVLIQPPLNSQSLKTMSKYMSVVDKDPALKRKQIGDVSATMHSGTDLINGFPATIMSSLTSYRVLPGGIEKEFYRAGINVK